MITPLSLTSQLQENPAVSEFLMSVDAIPAAPQLSEPQYVNFGLAFASLRLPAESGLAHGLYTQLMTGLQIPDLLPDIPAPESEVAALRKAQEGIIQWLEKIRQREPGAIRKVASALSSAGNRIVMRPAFLAGKDTVEISYRYFPADFDAALGYVLMLLADRSRPFAGNLCRCKYAECQRYFLAVKPETGRPRRDYCSPDHFAKARTASGAARIRAYRQRKRAQPKRQSRRKTK